MSKKRSDAPSQEEKLQAVLIADSFDTRFYPLTHNKPRVLLPLVNRPMIDYTLEFLSVAGVEKTIIFCCAHSQQIKDFINASKWSSPTSLMQVIVISSETFQSMGDALRELDTKAMIRSDFILLHGDCIGNLPLKEICAEHKKNRLNDKGCVMTTIFRRAKPNHRIRSIEDESVLLLNPLNNQIVHYEKVANTRKFHVPLSTFQLNSNVSIHHDLQDTHISICSLNVPPLFSDNCDFETREAFINGILHDEITGNTIYAHIVDNGYATRIVNIATYDRVSRDILQRFTFPTVPDIQNKFAYQRHNIYKRREVQLEVDSRIEQNVAIGENTMIGKNAFITNSIIGDNCKINDNVIIRDSYIWDNTTIGNNCKLNTCIIANNVNIKPNVVINRGCIIGSEVIIGSKIELKEGTIIHYESDCDKTTDKDLVGSDGKGYLYVEDDDDSTEGEDMVQDLWGQSNESENEEYDKYSVSTAFTDNSDDDLRSESPLMDEINVFYEEVMDSLQRGIEEKINCENLILEVNSRKHAYNVSMNELNMLVMKAIIDLPNSLKRNANSANYYVSLQPCLDHLMPLIRNYIRSRESQNDCITAMEEYCLMQNEIFNAISLAKVMHYFYDNDIVVEDIIIEWFENPKPLCDCDPNDQYELRKNNAIQSLIKWLKEAEEESSSE